MSVQILFYFVIDDVDTKKKKFKVLEPEFNFEYR